MGLGIVETSNIFANLVLRSPGEESVFFINDMNPTSCGVGSEFLDVSKATSAWQMSQKANLDMSQIFVATNGNDTNPGTLDLPLASLQKAQELADAGDTIYIRGGTYKYAEPNISQVVSNLFACLTYLNKSGTQDNAIRYWAYPGETPVFDFTNVKPAGRRIVGIYVQGNFIHIKGIEMTGIQTTITGHTESYCIYSRGNNNIYEEIDMHDNVGTGLRHYAGGGNLFLNCDAYNNWDNVSGDKTGSNNDGFGCHPSPGAKINVFKGCRAWFNSDDGFDIIRADEAVVFDNCWAFFNGFSTSFQSLGDGNGFKAGGFAYDKETDLPTKIPRHTIRFCIAVKNKANGFYANHHLGGNDWYNNSAYNNTAYDFNMLNRPTRSDATNIDGPGYDHVLKNNMSFAQFGNGTTNIAADRNTQDSNTWTLGKKPVYDDFRSLDMMQLTAPRQLDGSLPEIDFLFLAQGSGLIDAGIDLGFPFKGNAPDLGALEFDQTTAITTIDGQLPDLVNLYPNYPNPFTSTTAIRYAIGKPGKINLSIYNLMGQKLTTLVNETFQIPGEYEVKWNCESNEGEKCGSGIYFYQLKYATVKGNERIEQKMMIILD